MSGRSSEDAAVTPPEDHITTERTNRKMWGNGGKPAITGSKKGFLKLVWRQHIQKLWETGWAVGV